MIIDFFERQDILKYLLIHKRIVLYRSRITHNSGVADIELNSVENEYDLDMNELDLVNHWHDLDLQ